MSSTETNTENLLEWLTEAKRHAERLDNAAWCVMIEISRFCIARD